MPGSGPLRMAGVPSMKHQCSTGEPQASIGKAGGHSPPAPSMGSRRQESWGADALALRRAVKARLLRALR